MQQTITSEKLPVKLWLDEVEDGALKQIKNLANFPCAFHHIAIMPDCHQGYGMPIGGILATKGVVIPNAVGVDIGCGMCAVRTNLPEIGACHLQKLISEIHRSIPVGFSWHKEKQPKGSLPPLKDRSRTPIAQQEYENARQQLGTLGGGNHFIEVQHGSDGFIWLMIHSGSRNIGKKVAEHYNKLAVKLNNGSAVPRSWELAYLPLDSKEANQYLAEMNYCIEFAYANRLSMMKRIQEIFSSIHKEILFDPVINIAHNFANLEEHYGKKVWVHRKGATQAQAGQIGIIPGSQGSSSYIVVGKGNPESFTSCSHGAGRKMGRRQAVRELCLESERARLDSLGIIHSLYRKKDLEEAPSAYKDIDIVIKQQHDLIDIKVKLRPLAVVKG